MTGAFDTIKAARYLEAAGLERTAAKAVAGVIQAGQGELATKADLAATIASLKVDMPKLVFTIVIANAAITFGLLRARLP